MTEINIARDFSKTPFGRYVSDSPYSAEKFRQDLLVPAFTENNENVMIDFSGIAFGIGSSFLEEAFGGLVRKEGLDKHSIKKRLVIKSDVPFYLTQISRYIDLAQPEKK